MKDLVAQEAQQVPPGSGTLSPQEGSRMNMRIKLGLMVLAIFWLAVVAASWAEAAPPTASDDDEYSFNWLDPDKKIYVLQNRRYLKVNRALLSVMTGPGLSNSYRNSLNVEPRLAYYFTESLGFEVFYTNTFNRPNNTVDALQRATNTTLPVVREIRSQLAAMLHYVPWYAKINVFNKILYFDWYLAAGGGTVSSVLMRTERAGDATSGEVALEQSSPAAFFATGHQFHLSEQWVFRLDLTGAVYNSQIEPSSGDKAWYSNFNFGVGLGFRL